MIAALALALAASDPPSAPTSSTPSKPIGRSLSSIFSPDDYPTGAAQRREQGKVGILIHIDAAGAVSSCEIRQSSGFPELDTQTCAIIARRARFEPARDSAGKSVESTRTDAVVWRLAEEGTSSGPWSNRIVLNLADDGKTVLGCGVEIEDESLPKGATAPACPPGIQGVPAAAVLPDHTTLLLLITRFTPKPGPAPREQLGEGDVVIARSTAELSIDATGHVTACTQDGGEGQNPPQGMCDKQSVMRFVPHRGPDGKPAAFEATLAQTMIAHFETPAPAAH